MLSQYSTTSYRRRPSPVGTAFVLLVVLLAQFGLCGTAQAQFSRTTKVPPKQASSAPRTSISVELLADRRASGINSQRWGSLFRQLGISVRIRQPLLDDKPEVTEQMRGRLRLVTAVGILRRDGSIQFPDRTFRLTDTGKLKEWVAELTVYGAQGKTDGKPGFGLSKNQFEFVFRTLSEPIKQNLDEVSFDEALQKLEMPRSLPIRFASDAEDVLKRSPPKQVASGLTGLSRGTVLAVVLNNVGLGFHPGRTPAGTLEIVASPIRKDGAKWPIGWPLSRAPLHVAPKIVEVVTIDLDDEPFLDVLTGVSSLTKIPVLVDTWRIQQADFDLDKFRVTQLPKKMTWSGFLDRATFPKLMREILVDENGTPFVWITTRTVKQLNERAKQRDSQFQSKGK
jgi:hypothetical protein